MTETIQIIKDTMIRYDGEGKYLALFGLCVALLWLLRKEDNKKEDRIILYCLLTAVIVVFPLTAAIILKCIGANVYWRMAWIFPIVAVIAYTVVKLLGMAKSIKIKILVFLLLCMTVVGTGRCVYNPEVFQKYTNSYKLPDETIMICDMIREHAKEPVFLAAPNAVNPYVRIYDPDIKQAFGRDAAKEGSYNSPESVILHNVINQDPVRMESVAAAARSRGCNYLVLKKEDPVFGVPENFDLEVVGTTENYVVVYVKKV